MTDQAIPGAREFRFGERVVTLYPLSLKQLRVMQSDIQAIARINAGSMGEQFDVLLKIFLASARRGSNTVTAEDIEAVADMANMQDMIETCITQRMMRRGLDAGPQSPRIGGESSPELPTPQDGLSTQSGS